ncbi:MAG: tetratricopeptide repeat protein [Candidatus Delongbacteria bacterium]
MAKNEKSLNMAETTDYSNLEREYRTGLNSGDKKTLIDSLIGLGTLYYEKNKFSESEKSLKQALDHTKGRYRTKLSLIYRTLGLVYLKLFRLRDSEQYLQEAVKLTPAKNKRILSIVYHSLGDTYTRMTMNDTGLDYYFKALKLREKLSLWTGVSETLNKIGGNYYFQCKYKDALEYIRKSLDLRKKRNEKKENIAACYNNLCLTHFQLAEYDLALEYGFLALDMFRDSKLAESQGMVYNNLGLVYFEMSLFSEALDCQFKALKIKEGSGNAPSIANTLSNIGIILTRLFDLDRALEYSNKALKIREDINDLRGIANSYNDIGRIYDKKNDFGKAIAFLKDSIKIRREQNTLFGLSVSLENLGMIYFKQNKYSKAKELLFEAKRINEEIGEKKAIAGINRNISNLHLSLGEYKEALVYIERSYDMAKELGLKDKLRDAYKIFSEIYSRKKNYKKALHYYTKYSEANEEVLSIKKQNKINSITAEYENYKNRKEKEIYKLKSIELAKINKELKRSRSELLRSNFSKDRFFNIIAHDLKNPFSILYTTSELLYEYYSDLNEKKQREYINTINLSTKHLLKLVENLLEWSRSQSGLKQFNPQRFNFSESLNNCIELLNPNLQIKDIKLHTMIRPDLFIHADKNMIKTVVRNYMTNAIKFTNTGGNISIKAKTERGKFFFYVSDDGVGVRKKDIPKLFVIDKHFVTNGTSNEKGTGLGLLLCKEFVEKHDGEVYVESRFKKGSTFGFSIPLK